MDYEETTLLPVSFAPLILPGKKEKMKSIDIGKTNHLTNTMEHDLPFKINSTPNVSNLNIQGKLLN